MQSSDVCGPMTLVFLPAKKRNAYLFERRFPVLLDLRGNSGSDYIQVENKQTMAGFSVTSDFYAYFNQVALDIAM